MRESQSRKLQILFCIILFALVSGEKSRFKIRTHHYSSYAPEHSSKTISSNSKITKPNGPIEPKAQEQCVRCNEKIRRVWNNNNIKNNNISRQTTRTTTGAATPNNRTRRGLNRYF